MTDTVFVAVLSLIGTLGGTFGGILTSSKLTDVEKAIATTDKGWTLA